MPPRRRKATADTRPLHIGVVGLTPHTEKDIAGQLDSLADGRDTTVIVPVSAEHDNESFDDVFAWAANNGHTAVAVIDPAETMRRSQKSLLDQADSTAEAETGETLGQAVASLLADPEVDGRLAVFCPDDAAEVADDTVAMDALETAWGAEVPAYNLRDALDPITSDDEGDEPAAVPEPEPEPAPKTRRRRAPAAEQEELPADEAQAETPEPTRRTRRKATEPEVAADPVVSNTTNGHADPVQVGSIFEALLDEIADQVAARLK